MPEGKVLNLKINKNMNNYRLSTYHNLALNLRNEKKSVFEIEEEMTKLFIINSPYDNISGIRKYRNTNK
jgi:hypothetical protein